MNGPWAGSAVQRTGCASRPRCGDVPVDVPPPSSGLAGLLERLLTHPPLGVSDADLAAMITGQPRWDGLGVVVERGGLAGLQRSFPKTYAAVARNATGIHGPPVWDWLQRNDAPLYVLATNW